MPGHERNDERTGGQQQVIVRSQMLALMRQHELLLVHRALEQPARHHDLGAQHPDHCGPDVGRDANTSAEQLGLDPAPPGATDPQVHERQDDEREQ